eukprot:CAMPEP_0201530134 /NCGR_PEP_ID=MMETSP0161_2-20130828/43788_1 /ASSEMBLY_ACC=CAM_ASM_000251 /TAXON_ID=180227 /ORGANISM="Neoparamoeba aestuarina, Strain SoJaBio B1-5/56/2" /LENGTH=95 /DNA_ID=CAMNT_0047932315 /DNA_START=259 /DNA_END=543 /DNA_ORIENTATION=-
MILFHNEIFGKIDLANLPVTIRTVDLSNNRIKGPISLINLPPRLRTIDLHRNRILQDRVWYDNLPENIASIILQSSPQKNRVLEVWPVHLERSVK